MRQAVLAATLLLCATAFAQPPAPTEPPRADPSAPRTPTAQAEPGAPRSENKPEERTFKPSEEVSADKEVDFPADL